MEETARFVDHDKAAKLSVPVAVVVSARSTRWASTSLCPKIPASSRSEFVTFPVGFDHETRSAWIASGNGQRQRRGGFLLGRRLERGRASRAAAVLSPLLLSIVGLRDWPSEASYKSKASGSQTPPIPWPDASQQPTSVGTSGTISAIRVGRKVRSSASHLKSSMASLK